MSFDETDVVERLHQLAEGFEMLPAPVADDVRRGRRRVRRTRVLVVGAAAATVAVVLGVTVAVSGHGRPRSDGPKPVQRPGLVVGAVPVWYDAEGLHRGGLVERTPVDIAPLDGNMGTVGALALVRSGALYLDPARGDVWFHPWGGDPRIVGHNSGAGPGGDPAGDTAAWFDGDELVLYDTATGREISRTRQSNRAVTSLSGDHNPAGNDFLQVSADQVVWQGEDGLYTLDVRAGTTSAVELGATKTRVLDVQDKVEALFDRSLVVRAPGRPDARYPDTEPRARLSPSGSYVAVVEGTETRHAAMIIDIRTGELWRLPNGYPSNAWSYGDVAMVDIEDALYACDATRRTCERMPAEHPFLLPTS